MTTRGLVVFPRFADGASPPLRPSVRTGKRPTARTSGGLVVDLTPHRRPQRAFGQTLGAEHFSPWRR
jgi:hypothetical protein